ncbi:MAG: DUF3369 domain-containing protein [Clostridia bacterium]|nr:DUF3369 domain-containing protein [Clostridia bacterium]
MRRANEEVSGGYRLALLDDEVGIIDSLSVVMKRNGYNATGFTNPLEAIERIRHEHFDLLILDYLMEPIHGDEVVEEIRKFNKELYILLLTGHKDLAPPLETIRNLDIQGYCEKSDKFDQLILLIESGIKSIYQVRTINRYKDGLNKMIEAVPEIYRLKPLGDILQEILNGLMLFDRCESAFIYIDPISAKPYLHNQSIYRGVGKYNLGIEQFLKMLDAEMIENIGRARNTKQCVISKEGVSLPLLNEYAESMGILHAEGMKTEDSLRLLEIYSKQAASSICNAFLHSMLHAKNEELNETYDALKKSYIDTVEALRLAVDAKDEYTRGHSDRVAYYAVKTGEAFGLPADEIGILKLGGIFHDVGKIGTADDILFKTESLDNREYTEVKKHTLKGAHILSAVSMFKDVVPLVKYHHERLDGKGYPEGLRGEEIPFLARILSVADAFDAMTSDRLYRSRMELSDAIDQLRNASGTQFDPAVVEKFIELLKCFDQMTEDLKDSYSKE